MGFTDLRSRLYLAGCNNIPDRTSSALPHIPRKPFGEFQMRPLEV